jgi:hypothetical protein
MIHTYGGIDPGKSGCLATIEVSDLMESAAVTFYDTPTAETVKAGKTKLGNDRHVNVYLPHEMAAILRKLNKGGLTKVVIEEALVMPGGAGRTPMPASKAKEVGLGMGIWVGILAMGGIPFERVHPATWKAKLMAGQPKTKEAAAPFVTSLYPMAAAHFRGPKGGLLIDRADALLLAHYARITSR